MKKRITRIQKIIFISILALLFFGCTQVKNKTELELTCASINEMMHQDQDLRKKYLMPQYFMNLDSLIKSAGYSEGYNIISQLDDELIDSLKAQARKIEKPFTKKQKELRDSVWLIQNKIDSLNTIQLISTINKFGIDSLNKMDIICDENSLIIFVHCPEGLKEKVRDVINQNKKEVGENRFRHISWHLDGRVR